MSETKETDAKGCKVEGCKCEGFVRNPLVEVDCLICHHPFSKHRG